MNEHDVMPPFRGCAVVLANAIEKFYRRWRPDSARSRLDSVYVLLERLVDPAWIAYVDSLPCEYFGKERSRCKKLVLSKFARLHGSSGLERFTALENEILAIHREFLRKEEQILKSATSVGECERISQVIEEFNPTLDTLRALAYTCRGKQLLKERAELIGGNRSGRDDRRCRWGAGSSDKERCNQATELEAYLQGNKVPALSFGLRLSSQLCSRHEHGLPYRAETLAVAGEGAEGSVGKILLNPRRTQVFELCRFCGRRTELIAYLQEAHSPGATTSGRKATARLSSRYCVQHRPRLHDGTWNPDYLRARRQEKKFDTELARLQKQSACFHEFAAGTGNPAVDVFVRNLVNRLNVFADEESDIRRAARHLIESKISDRKKEIVTLLVSGWRQSDIGRKLGISRQAVSKALKSKSIPIAYRFDLVALG